jgi:hypothetical protein
MKRPQFEEALASVAERMNMSSIELLREVMNLKQQNQIKRVELEHSDEYIDAACSAIDECENNFDNLIEELLK